jgi:hypothetical protein
LSRGRDGKPGDFKIDLGEHVKSIMQLGDDVSWAPRVRAGCGEL